MTDQPPPGSGEQPDIRALLAEAGRERVPLPEDVAARLDATLEDLVAERRGPSPAPGGPAAGDVVPLAPDERRTGHRWGPRLLAAAAAVALVAGVGLGLHAVGNQGGTSMSTASSGGRATGERSGTQDSTAAQAPAGAQAVGSLPRLTTRHFRHDAAGLVHARAARTPAPSPASAGAQTSTDAKNLHGDLAAGRSCRRPPATGSAELVAARVNGRRATLVLTDLAGGRTRVSAYTCSAARLLARATVGP